MRLFGSSWKVGNLVVFCDVLHPTVREVYGYLFLPGRQVDPFGASRDGRCQLLRETVRLHVSSVDTLFVPWWVSLMLKDGNSSVNVISVIDPSMCIMSVALLNCAGLQKAIIYASVPLWDHNGNKCLHFFVSSFYLMYFVFISYVYLYNVLHSILNKSIHPSIC